MGTRAFFSFRGRRDKEITNEIGVLIKMLKDIIFHPYMEIFVNIKTNSSCL